MKKDYLVMDSIRVCNIRHSLRWKSISVQQELSITHRNFAPSRDAPDLARRLDGPEEAMIADLKHAQPLTDDR